MTGPQLDGLQLGGDVDSVQEQERPKEPQDMDAFRKSLIRQTRYVQHKGTILNSRRTREKTFLILGVVGTLLEIKLGNQKRQPSRH